MLHLLPLQKWYIWGSFSIWVLCQLGLPKAESTLHRHATGAAKSFCGPGDFFEKGGLTRGIVRESFLPRKEARLMGQSGGAH